MSVAITEALRQQSLLAAIAGAGVVQGVAESGTQLALGLGVYRANAAMVAERALAARHPVLQQMLGGEGLALLARGLWRAHPPRRGDLAQWGRELPDFIEAQPELAAWPYLADMARLELAIAACESAADVATEPATLALLAEHEPSLLRIEPMPSLRLLQSDWPLLEMHAAHAPSLAAEARDAALAGVAEAVAARRARPQRQRLLVARHGWRAEPLALDEPNWQWMAALQRGEPLDVALAAAGDDFDVSAWLARALQQGWFRRVLPLGAEATDPGD